MITATRNYAGDGLVPVYNAEEASVQGVALAPGAAILKGTVMGQVTNATGAAINAVHTISKTGTVSGGAFTLTSPDGTVSAIVAATATAATLQTALETILGVGNVTCTGGPINTTDVVITYVGMCAGLAMPLWTVTYTTALTGSTPVLVFTLTTGGQPAGGHWVAYDDAGTDDGRRVAKGLMQYDTVADNFGKITFGRQQGGGDYGIKDYTAPVYFAGTFRASDLTGIDAAAVADLGKLISGVTLTLSTTILRIG